MPSHAGTDALYNLYSRLVQVVQTARTRCTSRLYESERYGLELDDVGEEHRRFGGDGTLARHDHHALAEEGLALG